MTACRLLPLPRCVLAKAIALHAIAQGFPTQAQDAGRLDDIPPRLPQGLRDLGRLVQWLVLRLSRSSRCVRGGQRPWQAQLLQRLGVDERL